MQSIIINPQFYLFMKRIFMILSILLLIPLILAGCRNPVIQSQWVEEPITIDGKNTDWDSISLHKVDTWNASMGFCNDAGFLYILIHLEDPMLAMRVRTGGIVLVFRHQDENEPVLEFRFTGTDTIGPGSKPGDSFWEILNSDQKRRFMTRKGMIENMITLIKDGQSERVPSDGSKGLSATRIRRQGFYGYEFKIPILAEQTGIYTLGVSSGASFNFGIRLGANMPESEMVEGRSREGTLVEEQEFWFQIFLADNNLAYISHI
jgi:hypothetical protein